MEDPGPTGFACGSLALSQSTFSKCRTRSHGCEQAGADLILPVSRMPNFPKRARSPAAVGAQASQADLRPP